MSTDKRIIRAGKYQSTVAHYDETEDTLHVEEKFDVEPALIAAKAARETTPSKGFRHIGEVPMWIVHKAMREGWYHDKAAWRKFLRENPDFAVHKA